MTPNPRWTEQEKKHLKEHYGSIGADKLSRLLPGRTPNAIMDMAWRMDVRKCHDRLTEMGRENVNRRWNPPEIQA